MLALSALAPTLLSGCALFAEPKLPAPPEHLVQCASEAGVDIAPGAKTKAEVAGLLADLRRSETANARCAAGWYAFYEALRADK